MTETSSRVQGNSYKLTNLIAELIKMKESNNDYIDLVTIDNGYMDPDTEEWVPDIEYKIVKVIR